MKANEDKDLEKLVHNIMRGASLESPADDFTSKVMSQVLATKTSDITVYKPLISNSGFIAIFTCIFSFILYLILNTQSQTKGWFSKNEYLSNYKDNLTGLFDFSSVATYAVVLTTIMFFIQIPLLKNYFDKQLKSGKNQISI
ncbi:MAG: hypothetical protein HOP11_04270 [Saprospiraceae bacterium]|nr:hypothetical protein [Saprospiraceae bacterium]